MVLFLLGGLAVVVALALAYYVRVQPNNELTAMTAAKQWELAENDTQLPDTFGGQPFASGYSRVARYVVRGHHNGRVILLADYEFRDRRGDGGEHRRYWVACVDDLPAELPALEVVPRAARADKRLDLGILDGAAEFLTGDAAFDQRFRVTAIEHQSAAAVLAPEVVRLLASWPDLSWRIEGTRLLTWARGRVWPQEAESVLTKLVSLADAIPEEVWRTARDRRRA